MSLKKVSNLDDLFELFELCRKFNAPIFRGHSKNQYTIQSSGVRRLVNSFKVYPTNKAIIELHDEVLLENAKNMNYHHHEAGKVLSDLELLANLQHQGAATSLVDFTKNLSVALWFSCRSEEHNGAVFIIEDETDVGLFKRMTQHALSNKTIHEILKETEDVLYIWKPPGLQTRILQQDSIFVFGLCEEVLNERSIKIKIDKRAKKSIVELLDRVFNVALNTLFMDFDGFAMANSQDESLATSKAKKLFLQGNEYFQENDFNKALDSYEKSIEIEPSSYESLMQMGATSVKLKKPKEAEVCYRKALEINPDDKKAGHKIKHLHKLLSSLEKLGDKRNANILCAAGNAYSNLDEQKIAVEYYKEAIEIDPSNSESHFRLGIAFAKLKEYLNAVDVYKKAIRLNPDNYKYCISISIAYKDSGETKMADRWFALGYKLRDYKRGLTIADPVSDIKKLIDE